jgi:hypothetical protein
MSPKSLTAIVGVLLAVATAPAAALDISIGASAGGNAGGSAGEKGGSANFGLSTAVSANAQHDTDGGGVDLIATGSAAAAGDVDIASSIAEDDPLRNVVALIESSEWTSTSFETVTGINGSTYDLGAWITSDNSAALETALASHAAAITSLQAAISANATFSAWVDAQDAEVSSVVALGFAADGSLAVFTYN